MTPIRFSCFLDKSEDTHKPPSINMLVNCILRSLDTWSRHKRGIGRQRVVISVSTLKEPMIMHMRLILMQVGFSTVGSHAARTGRH